MQGTVGVAEHLGSETFLHVDGLDPLTVHAVGSCPLQYGEDVYLSSDAKKMHRFGEDGNTTLSR